MNALQPQWSSCGGLTSGYSAHRVAGRQLCGEGEQLFMATDSDCSVTLVQTQSTDFLGMTHMTRHNVQKCMLYFYTRIHYMRLGRNSSCKQPMWLQIQSWELEFLYAENNTTARAYFYPGSSYSDFCWLHHSLKIIFFGWNSSCLILDRKWTVKSVQSLFVINKSPKLKLILKYVTCVREEFTRTIHLLYSGYFIDFIFIGKKIR